MMVFEGSKLLEELTRRSVSHGGQEKEYKDHVRAISATILACCKFGTADRRQGNNVERNSLQLSEALASANSKNSNATHAAERLPPDRGFT